MPYVKTSLRSEKRALQERMRDRGCDYREIAAELARVFRLRPRAAWRDAYGWSLQQTANRINSYRRVTGLDSNGLAGMTAPHLSEYENWPGQGAKPSGRKPSPYLLAVLAGIYRCDVTDLVDEADRERLPKADLLIIDTYARPEPPSRPNPVTPELTALIRQRHDLGVWLREQRLSRRWPASKMASELRSAALAGGDNTLPSAAILTAYVLRWERGTVSPTERYRLYYCTALDISPDEYGPSRKSSQVSEQPEPVLGDVREGERGEAPVRISAEPSNPTDPVTPGLADNLAAGTFPGETRMGGKVTALKTLIRQRHMSYGAFCREWDRVAKSMDGALIGHYPGRAQYYRWLGGDLANSRPYPDACRMLEAMFPGWPVERLFSPYVEETTPAVPVMIEEDQEEMERRRLLQSLAALGVQVSPLNQALETVRTALSATVGYDARRQLDHWEESVVEYGYSYRTLPPSDLIPNLATDLLSIRSAIRRIPAETADHRSWCRVGGALSGLMAKSLSNLGHSRDSREWWNMALHLSEVSGDLDLGLWVQSQRIIHGLYENRPFPVLLRQIGSAMEFSRDHPCAGLADLSAARAQTAILSGNYRAAEDDLNRTEEILDRLPPAITDDNHSAMGWGEAEFRYTQAWVYSHTGDEDKTDRAVQRSLSLYTESDSRSPVQVQLLQALARVQRGDISEGIRHAHAIYEPLASRQFTTNMVDALARRVLDSVPAEAHRRSDVAAYRLLVISPSQKEIEQ